MVEASPFICLVVPLDDCFERTETFLLPEALSGFVAVSVCVGVLIEQVRLFTFGRQSFCRLPEPRFGGLYVRIICVPIV